MHFFFTYWDLFLLFSISGLGLLAYLFLFGGFYNVYMSARKQRHHGKFKYPSFPVYYEEFELWGRKLLDPYSWLESVGLQRNIWIAEQTYCSDQYFSTMKTTRDKFTVQFKKIVSLPKQGTPFRRGKYFFYFKKDVGQQHHVLWRDDFDDNKAEVLNPNVILADRDYSFVVSTVISNDGQMVAYTVHDLASDGSSMYHTVFRCLESLIDNPNRLESSIPPSLIWGYEGVYYSNKEADKDSCERIYYHQLESTQDKDIVLRIFEGAPNWTLVLQASVSLDHIVVHIQDTTGSANNKIQVVSNCLAFEADEGELLCNRLIETFSDGEFELVASSGLCFWFRTNHNAPNFRIIKIDMSPTFENLPDKGPTLIPLHEVSDFTLTEEESRGGFDNMKGQPLSTTRERDSVARLNLEHNFLEIRGSAADISNSSHKAADQGSPQRNKSERRKHHVFIITECVPEDGEAFLESATVVAENLLLMKYSRNMCHELLVVEFKTNSIDTEGSTEDIISNPVPLKISLPGKGSIIGPSCQHLSSDFFYQYISFDEPGIVFWGLVGRSNTGTLEVSSQVIFKSPLSEEPIIDFQPEFETKMMSIPVDSINQNIPILLFGRSFSDKVYSWSKLSPQTYTAKKTYAEGVINSVSSATIRPRSCMIVLSGHCSSKPFISFSPSHYLFAKNFNGTVCLMMMPRSTNLKDVVSYVVAVAEYLIDGSYTTSDQLGIYGVGLGATITAACINLRPDLFGAVITDNGIYDLLMNDHKYQENFSSIDKLSYASEHPFLQAVQREFGNAAESSSVFVQCAQMSPLHNIPFADSNQKMRNSTNGKVTRNKSLVNVIEKVASFFAIEPEDLYCFFHFFELYFEREENNIENEEDSCDESDDGSVDLRDLAHAKGENAENLHEFNITYPAVLVVSGTDAIFKNISRLYV